MTAGCYCKKCGRVVYAAPEKVGQTVECPGCREPMEIVAAVSRDAPVHLECPRCRSLMRVVRELDGRRVRCTTCQTVYLLSANPWKLLRLEDRPPPIAD